MFYIFSMNFDVDKSNFGGQSHHSNMSIIPEVSNSLSITVQFLHIPES